MGLFLRTIALREKLRAGEVREINDPQSFIRSGGRSPAETRVGSRF